MHYINLIITIAGGVTAVGVLLGYGVKVWKFFVNLNNAIKEMKNTFKDLKTHDHENYMSLLRLTIMSSEMPIGERIVAGHKYLKEGGNGEVKSFLKTNFNIDETVDEAEHYKK